jgi:hypothetical protein
MKCAVRPACCGVLRLLHVPSPLFATRAPALLLPPSLVHHLAHCLVRVVSLQPRARRPRSSPTSRSVRAPRTPSSATPSRAAPPSRSLLVSRLFPPALSAFSVPAARVRRAAGAPARPVAYCGCRAHSERETSRIGADLSGTCLILTACGMLASSCRLVHEFDPLVHSFCSRMLGPRWAANRSSIRRSERQSQGRNGCVAACNICRLHFHFFRSRFGSFGVSVGWSVLSYPSVTSAVHCDRGCR